MSTVDERISASPQILELVTRNPRYAELRDKQRTREGTPRASDSYPAADQAVASLVHELMAQPRYRRPYGATNAIATILGISRQSIYNLLQRHGYGQSPTRT